MGRHLGQHFLKDQKIRARIAAALELKKGEVVIEIGPGHGELTEELATWDMGHGTRKAQIIAIEKDPKLARELQEKSEEDPRIKVIEGDVRAILPLLVPGSLSHVPYKVCGNIPYYLTGFLLRMIGELDPPPARVVLMVQKEVAERMCAAPGNMNRLAAAIQMWAAPRIFLRAPRGAFFPPPKVDSAVVVLQPRTNVPTCQTGAERKRLSHKAIQALFAQPRKTLLNNVAGELALSKEEAARLLKNAEINPALRPQSLSLAQIEKFASLMKKSLLCVP